MKKPKLRREKKWSHGWELRDREQKLKGQHICQVSPVFCLLINKSWKRKSSKWQTPVVGDSLIYSRETETKYAKTISEEGIQICQNHLEYFQEEKDKKLRFKTENSRGRKTYPVTEVHWEKYTLLGKTRKTLKF